LGGGVSYFDCHRCFLPLDHPFRLDSDTFKKNNIILEGPPRHLCGPEIADIMDNLVFNKNGDVFVRYGKEHNVNASMDNPWVAHALSLLGNRRSMIG
jgi:hypothetical protein